MLVIVGQANTVTYNLYTAPGVALTDDEAVVNAYLKQKTGTNAGKWWNGTAWVTATTEPVAGTCTISGTRGEWDISFPSAVWEKGAAYTSYASPADDSTIVASVEILAWLRSSSDGSLADYTATDAAIANMALARIGGDPKIVDLSTDTSNEAKKVNLFYAQTRDSLLRSHTWKFAVDKVELTATVPQVMIGDWLYEWDMPTDCLRVMHVYRHKHKIAGSVLYTMDDTAPNVKYVKRVTDPTLFDSLFTEVFVLELAMKLVPALAGAGGAALQLGQTIKSDLKEAMSTARLTNMIETDADEDCHSMTWLDSRRVNIGGWNG